MVGVYQSYPLRFALSDLVLRTAFNLSQKYTPKLTLSRTCLFRAFYPEDYAKGRIQMTLKISGDGVSVEIIPRVPARPIVVKLNEDKCTRGFELREPEILGYLNHCNYPHAPKLVSVVYTCNERTVCRHVVVRCRTFVD